MKSIKLFQILTVVFLCLFLNANFLEAQTKSSIEDNVNITIDKSTSDKDFDSIKEMLSEYGINAFFENIKRNQNDEITGISITLSTENGQQTSSSFSSNLPINSMSFGSKNGNLYIGNSSGGNMFALFNNNNFAFPFDMDSLFAGKSRSFKLDDFFKGNSNMFFFDDDSLDVDALKKKFMKNFNYGNSSRNNISDYLNRASKTQKFNFIDNPDKETLIVIDGKISDFETLDRLAKSDKLSDVDVLKPETAISIYGKKAKDGAIIATTKD